jgi:transposase-like protein
MKTDFKSKLELTRYYADEDNCKKLLAQQRWGDTPACPHCGNAGKIYVTNRGYKCGEKTCYKKFTVTTGTIFEHTRIPLNKWFEGIFVISAHKKGISSHQLAKDIDVSQKTAWFILHRVREMLKANTPEILEEGTVEVDETAVGGKEGNKHKKLRNRANKGTGFVGKTMVMGVLHRDGKVWTKVVPDTTKKTLQPIVRNTVGKKVTLITDTAGGYAGLNKEYHHETVNHTKDEYVRGEYHTNGIEGYWSLLKRGIIGIYHQVSPKHLQRYCDEFSYRYNSRKITDVDRFTRVLTHCEGKLTWNRLTEKEQK